MSEQDPKVENQKEETSTKGRRSRDGSRRGQNSQPSWWKKGAPSPNPAGRPLKTSLEFRELCRQFTMEAVYTLAERMRDKRFPSEARQAAKEILDRAWGKAVQPIAGPDAEGPLIPGVGPLVESLRRVVAGAPIQAEPDDEGDDDDDGDGDGEAEAAPAESNPAEPPKE